MTRPLGDVLAEGVLGAFYPQLTPRLNVRGEPQRGWLRLVDGEVVLDALEEGKLHERLSTPDLKLPIAYVGTTTEDAVILLERTGGVPTLRIGALSSSNYSWRTAVGGLPGVVRSIDLTLVSADFYDVARFCGLERMKETFTQESGRVKEVTITVRSTPSKSHPIRRNRQLTLENAWTVGGPFDHRRVAYPVRVRCTAAKPRRLWDLLAPVLRVQDLFGLAHGRPMLADGGRAVVHGAEADEPQSSLWSAPLHATPDGGLGRGYQSPLFALAQVGGIRGLARWVDLYESHPRAVMPIVRHLRDGALSPEVTTLECATGIEYWVKANQRSKWASAALTSKPKKIAEVLGERLDPTFAAWCGDPNYWCKSFWDTCNNLKHEPSYKLDHQMLTHHARLGQLLLTATLLDRVALNTVPSRTIFAAQPLSGLGERLRAALP